MYTFSITAFSAESNLVFTFSSSSDLQSFIDGEHTLDIISDRQARWSGDGDVEMLSVHNSEAEAICYNGPTETAANLIQTLVYNSDCNGAACLARLDDDETIDIKNTYIYLNGNYIELRYTYYGEEEYRGHYTIPKCE